MFLCPKMIIAQPGLSLAIASPLVGRRFVRFQHLQKSAVVIAQAPSTCGSSHPALGFNAPPRPFTRNISCGCIPLFQRRGHPMERFLSLAVTIKLLEHDMMRINICLRNDPFHKLLHAWLFVHILQLLFFIHADHLFVRLKWPPSRKRCPFPHRRIVAATSQRIAPGDPPSRHKSTSSDTILSECIHGVLGTCGHVATARRYQW